MVGVLEIRDRDLMGAPGAFDRLSVDHDFGISKPAQDGWLANKVKPCLARIQGLVLGFEGRRAGASAQQHDQPTRNAYPNKRPHPRPGIDH